MNLVLLQLFFRNLSAREQIENLKIQKETASEIITRERYELIRIDRG